MSEYFLGSTASEHRSLRENVRDQTLALEYRARTEATSLMSARTVYCRVLSYMKK